MIGFIGCILNVCKIIGREIQFLIGKPRGSRDGIYRLNMLAS